jgi:hypothetical protein
MNLSTLPLKQLGVFTLSVVALVAAWVAQQLQAGSAISLTIAATSLLPHVWQLFLDDVISAVSAKRARIEAAKRSSRPLGPPFTGAVGCLVLLGALAGIATTQTGCIRLATIGQIQNAVASDVACGDAIAQDVDAGKSIADILQDTQVTSVCSTAIVDTGMALVDLIADVAAKHPTTPAGREALARKAAR